MTTIALLGVGKLGEALLSGLLRSGTTASSLIGSERHSERAAEMSERYGVQMTSVAEAVAAADLVLVAVKPQDIKTAIAEIGAALRPGTLVVSMAAGIPTSLYERLLPSDTPVVRVMTNTPVFVDQAMSALSPGTSASDEHLAVVEDLLRHLGKVVRLPETQLDAVTALSGSGPAYFFFLVEAMIDAGILLGLPRTVAADLIVQTALGSAVMLRDSGEHPVQLREAVTSPGGTTIAAIRELEVHGVRAALLAAIEAARDRSRELAAEQE